jgi:5-methylcytosine-specific restriction endonuclease McrA
MTNKIYEITDEQFVELVRNSTNISEVLFKLGYSVKGNSWGFSQVRRRMEALNLTPQQFKGKSALKTSDDRLVNPENLLCKNSKHARNVLRRYILSNNLIPYRCAICGITHWNNKALSLELDHINGINNDNRLENLRFLCPNCHSQTTTYGSRNQQKNESKYEITEDLRQLVESTYEKEKSVKRVSTVLGIRRCVVTQIVNESGQKHSNQLYVIRYDENWNELKRYGSLSECARDLIDSGEIKTNRVSTGRRSIQMNANKKQLWLNSYWITLDGNGIINNPLLESSLIDSENNVDEAQAKAA